MNQINSAHNLICIIAHQRHSCGLVEFSLFDGEAPIVDETYDGHVAHDVQTMKADVVHAFCDLVGVSVRKNRKQFLLRWDWEHTAMPM